VPGDLYRYLHKKDQAVKLKINGQVLDLKLENGYARIRRNWKAGDIIELELPMPIRRAIAHEKVEDNRGRVALERGPLLYCAEGVDNQGEVLALRLPDSAELKAEFQSDLLGGVTVIRGKADTSSLSSSAQSIKNTQREFIAIPYYAWAHRGRGEMAVWLNRN
jgi:DUF1680 family protein